jgi:hypothetical protein
MKVHTSASLHSFVERVCSAVVFVSGWLLTLPCCSWGAEQRIPRDDAALYGHARPDVNHRKVVSASALVLILLALESQHPSGLCLQGKYADVSELHSAEMWAKQPLAANASRKKQPKSASSATKRPSTSMQ